MMIMTIFFTPISCPATNNWSIQMSSYLVVFSDSEGETSNLKLVHPVSIVGEITWNWKGGKLPYQMGSIQFSYLFVRGEKLDGVWGFLSIENDVSVCPKVWQFHQLRIWSESFVSVCVAFLNLRLNECESRAFSVSLFLDRIWPLILIYCVLFLFFFFHLRSASEKTMKEQLAQHPPGEIFALSIQSVKNGFSLGAEVTSSVHWVKMKNRD